WWEGGVRRFVRGGQHDLLKGRDVRRFQGRPPRRADASAPGKSRVQEDSGWTSPLRRKGGLLGDSGPHSARGIVTGCFARAASWGWRDTDRGQTALHHFTASW